MMYLDIKKELPVLSKRHSTHSLQHRLFAENTERKAEQEQQQIIYHFIDQVSCLIFRLQYFF